MSGAQYKKLHFDDELRELDSPNGVYTVPGALSR